MSVPFRLIGRKLSSVHSQRFTTTTNYLPVRAWLLSILVPSRGTFSIHSCCPGQNTRPERQLKRDVESSTRIFTSSLEDSNRYSAPLCAYRWNRAWFGSDVILSTRMSTPHNSFSIIHLNTCHLITYCILIPFTLKHTNTSHFTSHAQISTQRLAVSKVLHWRSSSNFTEQHPLLHPNAVSYVKPGDLNRLPNVGPCSVAGHVPTLPWLTSRVWVRVGLGSGLAAGKGWVGTWPGTRLDPMSHCFLTSECDASNSPLLLRSRTVCARIADLQRNEQSAWSGTKT